VALAEDQDSLLHLCTLRDDAVHFRINPEVRTSPEGLALKQRHLLRKRLPVIVSAHVVVVLFDGGADAIFLAVFFD